MESVVGFIQVKNDISVTTNLQHQKVSRIFYVNRENPSRMNYSLIIGEFKVESTLQIRKTVPDHYLIIIRHAIIA